MVALQMKEQLTIKHSEHIRNKEGSRKFMAEEQERGKMNPERIIIACFDLQKVLQCLCGGVSSYYYKSKLDC